MAASPFPIIKEIKMPPRSSRTLVILSLYAVVMAVGTSYFFVRDISNQLTLRNRGVYDDVRYYEAHFLPNKLAAKAGADAQQTSSSTTTTFPIGSHIVTHGHPRTATTLLFNMVAASYFLHLSHYDSSRIPTIHLQLWKRERASRLLAKDNKTTFLLKTHMDLSNFKTDNTVFFTAAVDRKEASETMQRLTKEGYNTAFVQDMESLREQGVPGLVSHYVRGYGLTSQDEDDLKEYFAQWEIIRQCCGQQMSTKWRNDMMPQQYKRNDLPSHPNCARYDIDQVEQAFMSSRLYAKIQQYPNLKPLNKPSLNDDNLNGTYCSSYNHRVQTEGLSFFGTPGGRPVRSKLDWAIKNEYNLGTLNLTPKGVAMMESIGMRELWRRDEMEKKVWLKKLLEERTVKGAKSYKLNLEEVDDTLEFHFDEGEEKQEIDDGVEDIDEQDGEDGEEESDEASGDMNDATPIIPINKNPDRIPISPASDHEFDKTHAIFLISFGVEAASSTLVERCVLSLRRRGQYNGYVVVLTDAPPQRYMHVWDENVIVMHPQREHLFNKDGTPMHYSKENMSLKPKRFKTYILDYIDMDQRLDSVELVYYLDIDILAGDTLDGLFRGLEEQYQVVGRRSDDDVSKLYFVTPLSKEWPFQSGTFIAERGTSQHCLDLWRAEIDLMLKTGRGRDQDALRNIYRRIESGAETKCELIRMENENYVSFPMPRNFAKLSAADSKHAHLIHISNSLFAKKIEEEEQNAYIHQILQLSKEEVESGMYGKAIVRAKESS